MMLKQWAANLLRVVIILIWAGVYVWWFWFIFMFLTERLCYPAGIAAGIVGFVAIAGLAFAMTLIERYG